MFDKDGLLAIDPAFSIFESERFAMRDCDILSFVQGISVTASARPVHGDRLVPSTDWAAFKDEFWLLMCSNDQKYKALHDAIENSTDKSQTILASMMAGALGTYLGIAAGLLIPLVVLSMVVVIRLGVGAFCRVQDLDRVQPIKAGG